MAGCQKWKPFVVILTVYFVMAVLNMLFKKILSEGMSGLVIVTYRLIASAIFLTPIAYFCERRNGINLTMPILGQLFFSALIGHESVNLRSKGGQAKVLGSLICFGGVLLLILYTGVPLNKVTPSGKTSYHTSNSNMEAKKWIFGSIFLVLSILLWSAWFLIQARIGKKYPRKYSSTALMSFFGAIQSAILCFAVNKDITQWVLRGKLQILTVLFAGILGSGLCYVGMAWCVEQKGPVFTSAFTPFIQIFIITLDLAFHNEQIYLGSVIGSIMVICGLYVLLWGKSSTAAENMRKPAEPVECNERSASATVSDVTPVTSDATCP